MRLGSARGWGRWTLPRTGRMARSGASCARRLGCSQMPMSIWAAMRLTWPAGRCGKGAVQPGSKEGNQNMSFN